MRARMRHAPELLDDASHDVRVLEQSLGHVAQVNRFLGGHSAALSAIKDLLVAGRTLRVLDIGTGSADIPREIVLAARRAHAGLHITATDLHPQMREIAASACAQYPEIDIDSADAFSLPYADASFDVALLSLTLHHFEDDEPVRALREAGRVARLVVVNELERGWMNYIGAHLLGATLWRRNVLTRHDGPLSVLRAFKGSEIIAIARAAGLTNIRLRKRWFFRLVMTAERAAP